MFFPWLAETLFLNNPPMKMLDFSGSGGFEIHVFFMFFGEGTSVWFFNAFLCFWGRFGLRNGALKVTRFSGWSPWAASFAHRCVFLH